MTLQDPRASFATDSITPQPVRSGVAATQRVFATLLQRILTFDLKPFDGISEGVLADIRIWENKIYRPNPVLCDGDKLIGKFRQWTKQFYSEAV